MILAEPKWLLLDTWTIRVREVLDQGFSGCETVGNRELTDLPNCPACKQRVWSRVTIKSDVVRFSTKRIGDITMMSPETWVVTDRFRDAWLRSGLTGLSFSKDALNCKFRAQSIIPAKTFVFAYPQPAFTNFSKREKVELVHEPTCPVCSSAEVRAAFEPKFSAIAAGTLDCFLPSCMPGWVVVSERSCDLVRTSGLLNFSFMKGFTWTEKRDLDRQDYNMQMVDGKFRHYRHFVPAI